MNSLLHTSSLAFALFVFISLNIANADISMTGTFNAPAPVSLKTLNSKIKDAEANNNLDETSRTKLLEYHRKTIRYLEEIRENNAATEAFIRSRKTDPDQAAGIRIKLENLRTSVSPGTVDIFKTKTAFSAMEQQLFTEKANLAAVKAKLSDIEQQLELVAVRPNAIRQRLIEANRSQEEITARILQPEIESGQPLLDTAVHWMLETRQLALSTEIRRLDQELLSLPMRIDLFEAGQAWNESAVERLKKLVATMQERVNQLRQVEADKAKLAAEKAQRELEGKHPLIQQLAGDNAALTDELSLLTKEFERITRESEASRKEYERLAKQFQKLRKKLDIGGFGQALGQVMIEQQRQFPERDTLQKRADLRKQKIAGVALQQLQYGEDYRELSSTSGYIDHLTETLSEQETGQIRSDLKKLAKNRRILLKKLNQLSGSYLNALSDYEFIDQELLSTTRDYDNFLSQNLIWIRSAPIPSLASLQELPTRLSWLVSPVLWHEVYSALAERVTASPVPALGLLLAIVLFWKRKSLHRALRKTGENVGKINKDSIVFTLNALGLTLLLAASWPLLLSLFAWQLNISPLATHFTNIIATSIIGICVHFFFFRLFYITCETGGLGAVHFQVAESTVQKLHREFGRLMLSVLPVMFIIDVMYNYNLADTNGEPGRTMIAIVLLALIVFFVRISYSKKEQLLNDSCHDSWGIRWNPLLRTLLLAIPLTLLVLNFIGYIFTATILTSKLIFTLWFLLILMVVKKLAVRWLMISQRRFAWKTALEKRAEPKAKREAESTGRSEIESESGEGEEPEIDFAELSQESLYLLNVALLLSGILGILAIWANVLPAFNLLDEIVLWSHTAVVSGEEQFVPLTLLDFSQALLIAFITLLVAKYLPSLLEIIMLQRTSLSTGSRYTVTTITNYMIIAVGLILFFNKIGVDWSKVQWLIAALGVGIGFGLQEIVANFISGIIILFERPIRVGDIVTIGNNDGMVVRIRIRATTIRNWDRKELLVPNKEFITGQLINWTLSESTTRIVIPVGLAYGGDVELALKTMLETAEEHPDVLSDPGPSVVFDAFGDNALSLKLRCFVPEIDYRVPTITALHKTINRKFNEAGLVIAFPQRDVHLDTSAPLDIHIR